MLNKEMIYILFGPPGVGKTYLGELLSSKYSMRFFDADTLLDSGARRKIRLGQFNQDDRNEFFKNLIQKTRVLLEKNSDLIIAESFIKEVNRHNFKDTFPESKYIYVHCPYNVAKTRAVDRLIDEDHIIDTTCLDWLWNEFDTPEIEHSIIDNSGSDNDVLISSFQRIIGE